MNRNLTILTSAVVILGILVGGYFYFFGGSDALTVVPEGASGLPVAGQNALPTETTSSGTAEIAEAVSARLVKISEGPIVPGFAVTTKIVASSSPPEKLVSYIDRASGNVFVYAVGAKTITRTSNRTLPGIQSAKWLPNASAAIVRYLSGENSSTINTYYLRSAGGEGFFMPQNLSSVAASATNILSLASAANGSTLSSSKQDGAGTTELFSTPLSAATIGFLGRSSYLLTTKASATLPGLAFSTNARGETSRISGPLSGLSAIASPSGDWLAQSYTVSGEMRVALVNVATRESIALPIGTLIEKCVWTEDNRALFCGVPTNPPRALYPDDWYQGAVHFSDKIWKIDVAGRYAQLILDFGKETGGALDATALAIDANTTTLVFLNKNDESVWSYTL
jgi:hypothetical protein